MWDELPARQKFHDVRARVSSSTTTTSATRAATASSFRIQGRAEAVGAPGQTPDADRHAGRGPRRRRSRARGSTTWPSTASSAAALYPTYGLMIQGVTEREPALALCRALNDWLAEYCAHDPTRLVGVGHAADDGRRRRARRSAPLRRAATASAACGAGPSTSTRCRASRTTRTNRCGRTSRRPTCRSRIHPGMSGLVPYDELRGRFDDYFTPLHAAHFVIEQMMNAHDVHRLRDPRAPSRACGWRSSRPARCGRCRTCTASTSTSSCSASTAARSTMRAVRLLPPPVLRVGRGGRARASRRWSRRTPTRWCSRPTTRTPTARSPAPPPTLLDDRPRSARRRRAPRPARQRRAASYGLA